MVIPFPLVLMFIILSVGVAIFSFVALCIEDNKKLPFIVWIISLLSSIVLISWFNIACNSLPVTTVKCEIQRNGNVKYFILNDKIHEVDHMIDASEWEVEYTYRISGESHGMSVPSESSYKIVRKVTAEKN